MRLGRIMAFTVDQSACEQIALPSGNSFPGYGAKTRDTEDEFSCSC